MEKNISQFYEWAENYRFNLDIIEHDLDLITQSGVEIIVALDFYDIFQFCFPFSNSTSSERTIEQNKERIARQLILNDLNTVYKTPIVLLPPYLEEINEFFATLSKMANLYNNDKARLNYVNNIIKDYTNLTDNEIFEKISLEAPELILLVSEGLESGMVRYKKLLMNKKLDPRGLKLGNYKDTIKSLEKDDISELFDIVKNKRNIDGKYLQNKRDTKAILLSKKLNDSLSNKMLILISSANHMKRLIKEHDFTTELFGKKVFVVRDMEFIYVFLIEISRYLEKNELDAKINQVRPDEVLPNIKKHAHVLRSFFEEIFPTDYTISGVLKDEIRDQQLIKARESLDQLSKNNHDQVNNSLKEVLSLNEKIERIDMARILKNFVPENEIDMKLEKRELHKKFKKIMEIGESNGFSEYINDKYRYLEKEKLNNLIEIMFETKYQKDFKKTHAKFENIEILIDLCNENQIIRGSQVKKDSERESKWEDIEIVRELIKQKDNYFPDYYEIITIKEGILLSDNSNDFLFYLIRPNLEILKLDLKTILISLFAINKTAQEGKIYREKDDNSIARLKRNMEINVLPILDSIKDDSLRTTIRDEYNLFINNIS